MGQYDDRDYPVGKGKPPAEHQFKKGQSGNPRGPRRKKKARDATIQVLAHEAVNEMITVSLAGKERRMPKKEAMVMALANDTLNGTPSQRIKAMRELRELCAFDLAVDDHRLTPEIEQERALEILSQLIAEGERDEEMRHRFAEYNGSVP